MVQQNRLSHALLFLGKEGSGALPLAMAFAQYVCLLPKDSQQPDVQNLFGDAVEVVLPSTADEADAYMQKQDAFNKAQNLVHPDIHFSYPVITKKPGTPPLSTDFAAEWRAFFQQFPYGNVFDWLQFINAENKQGNITAAECNDITRKLALKSFESSNKVLVLWMPEYLGKEGNKLLKLIEEPPDDTLFILVAENEASILPTILSRCQLVRIPALQAADIEDTLMQLGKIEPQKARQLANASQGNYREALHLLQHADTDFTDLLREWLNAILKNQPAVLVKQIEEIAKMGRENQKQFLRFFTHLIEQAVRLEFYDEETKQALAATMTTPELDFAGRLNKLISIEQKEEIAAELNKASYYVERNANAKILFHALSIKIFHIVKNRVVVSV